MKCFQFVIPCQHEWAKFLQDVLGARLLARQRSRLSHSFPNFPLSLSLRLFSTFLFADICFHQRISKHREWLQETLLVRYTVIEEEGTSQGSHSMVRWSLYVPTALISKSCALFSQGVCTCFCKIFAITTFNWLVLITTKQCAFYDSVIECVCVHICIYIYMCVCVCVFICI